MLIGLGCTVPAILATRTLEHKRDRFTTILVAPFVSCGARMTIYALLIPAFFAPRWRGWVLWGIYLTGILAAILVARLLRGTVFRGESAPFVMELPPYRMPTWRSVGIHMWDRAWMYLQKAGTVILAISILLWALGTFPRRTEFSRDYAAEIAAAATPAAGAAAEAARQAEILEHTAIGRIGRASSPPSARWASIGAWARRWSAPLPPRRCSWRRWASCIPSAAPTRIRKACGRPCARATRLCRGLP
jgi:ferrous iron transport protein B